MLEEKDGISMFNFMMMIFMFNVITKYLYKLMPEKFTEEILYKSHSLESRKNCGNYHQNSEKKIVP